MNKFNVIIENNGKFEPFNVIPYLVKRYNDSEEKPKTVEEFKDFIIGRAKYQWWARCEYEIILSDWPSQKHEEKWDVFDQVMMNIDVVTQILMRNVVH